MQQFTSLKQLNSQNWYKVIKIVYISLFSISLFTLAISYILIIKQTIPTSDSLSQIGKIIKTQRSLYSNLNDYQTGQLVYQNNPNLWKQYQNLASYQYRFTLLQVIIIGSIITSFVFLIFETIKRLFFYIVLGTLHPNHKPPNNTPS